MYARCVATSSALDGDLVLQAEFLYVRAQFAHLRPQFRGGEDLVPCLRQADGGAAAQSGAGAGD